MLAGSLYSPDVSARDSLIRIAVSDLRAQGVEPGLASTMTDVFVYEVSRLSGLAVLGNVDIRASIKHQTLKNQLGCDENCWIQMAKSVDSDFLVHGSLGMVASTPNLTLTLIDIKKGEVTKRHRQELLGDSDAVFAAVRVSARQLLAPVLNAHSSSPKDNFGLPMLEYLRTAYKPRDWKYYGQIGGGMLGGQFDQVKFSSAMGTLAVGADWSLNQSVFLGGEVGIVLENTTKPSILTLEDPDTGEILPMVYSSKSQLAAGYLLAKGGVRKESGVILPYLAVGVGVAKLRLAMKEVDASEQEDDSVIGRVVREGGDSPAIVLAFSSGSDFVLSDSVGVSLDFRFFAYLNWLQYNYYPEGKSELTQETEMPGSFATIHGVQITVSMFWQN